jgi:hypothetical protein
MKKFKIILIASVILLAVGGAFATRPSCQSCAYQQQYYLSGGAYIPVGVFGYDYYCLNFSGTCTYYQPDPSNQSYFAPCKQGVYAIIP